MESVQMLEGWPFSNILCDICGKDVEILNNDLTFSKELHNQSHKKLCDINRLVAGGSKKKADKKLNAVQNYSQNYHCATCNKYFEIVNNDFELSLQLHTQNHEPNNGIQNKETLASNDLSSLDKTFNTFPPGLKCHRHFVYELDDNNAFCKVCDLEVGKFLNIHNHLKTKLHEDNILLSLKQKLPSSLHDVMEFVSFFGSNLYCNLCNSKIILCSNSIYESVLNIIAHNSSETHLKYKINSGSQEKYIEASSILKDLAKYENSTNKNKSYIEFKMVPQFKCKLCNTNVVYNENRTKMLNNLTDHLQNSTHRKLHSALVIEEFELDYISSDIKHTFIPKDDGVLCSACNIIVKGNIVELVSHIKQNNCCKKLNNEPNLNDKRLQLPVGSNTSIKPLDLFSNIVAKKCKNKNKNDSKTLQGQFSEVTPLKGPLELNSQPSAAFKNENDSNMYGVRVKLEIILNTLLKELDISWIKIDERGQVVCTICTCILTISTIAIKQHLSGTRHRNNKEKKVINSLFENIPGNLQSNKSFIKIIAADKSHVLCNKCNVKIPAHHKNLLEHLQGASHIKSFTKPIEGESKKDDKPEIAKLPELQQTKSCKEVISKNDLVEQFSLLSLKMSSKTSELKCVLDDLSEQYDTSSIMMNETGEITCVICICPVFLSKNAIKEHLAGLRHTENEKKKVVNGLFGYIPENLKWNKSFINAPVGEKNCVLCSKCNVKISAHHKNLLEHLQGASHIRAFTKPIEGQSEKVDKSEIAKLPELQQTKTSEEVISKNDLFEQFSLLSKEMSSKTSELKCILDDISKQIQCSCIQMNEKGEITCVICNCPVSLCKNVIKEHLTGIKHTKNENKNVVNGLFKNIPENLKWNKSFIKVPGGEKNCVLCSKCNVKISAHHKNLLEHLQGASHIKAFTKPIEGQSKNDDTSVIAKLPELQQTKAHEQVISKNGLVEKFSLLSPKMSSETIKQKRFLDDISKKFHTLCIQMNEKGEVICVICNCTVSLCKNVIKQHLAGKRHKKNEKNNIVNILFKNIPETLQGNKLFINVLAGDKSYVFCSKCNVLILAQHDKLLDHLRGVTHLRATDLLYHLQMYPFCI